ncbi:MAG: hypothetical protein ABH836_03635 [Candidatus Omnitrophota bacterium]
MISKKLHYAVYSFLIIFLFSGIYFLQLNINNIKKDYPKFENLLYLPTGKFINAAVLGFNNAVADVLYVKAVGYFGGHYLIDKEYKWFYHILDIITTLSPRFEDPYEFGAVVLALEMKEIELSNKLLKRGIEYNPDYWRFPFYLAFNYFFYLNDYAKAASYMEQASKLPDCPAYLPYLTSRLYAEAKNPGYAIVFLSEIYNETTNENIKKELKTRVNELVIEKDLTSLEKAISDYKNKYNASPFNLEDLVKKGLLSNVPEEPFGGYYYIDEKTGEPKSSTRPDRLKIYRQN